MQTNTPKTNAERQKAFRDRRAKEIKAARAAAEGATITPTDLPAAPAIETMPPARRCKAMIETAQMHIRSAREQLQEAVSEMEAWYDERTEQWQESDKGQKRREQLDAWQEALDALNDFDALDEMETQPDPLPTQ